MPYLSLILGLGIAIPARAFALQPDMQSAVGLCAFLPCGAFGGGALGFSEYILDRIVVALEIGVIAAAVIALFVAAAQMVTFGSEENAVKDARMTYVYVIAGLAIVGLARWFALAFSPTETGAALVNAGVVNDAVGNVVTYFRLIVAVTLLVNIVVQAFRLISSQGEQEQADKAKKRLIGGFIGAGVIMLANVVVESVVPGAGGSDVIAGEIAGIANYLLTIIGFLAVVIIVVAGIMLIVSVDESLKEKAKSMVKTAVVALVVILVAYALVTAFIDLG